ncbi:hypothetical protein AbraCBS73388_008146, partial [Aspergillus brasiliensis]
LLVVLDALGMPTLPPMHMLGLLLTEVCEENGPQKNTSNPLDTLTTDFILQHIKLPTEDFLKQCSRHEESEQARLFLDIFSSIPLCE